MRVTEITDLDNRPWGRAEGGYFRNSLPKGVTQSKVCSLCMDEKNSNVDDENLQILDAEARDPSGQDEESSPQWLAIMKLQWKSVSCPQIFHPLGVGGSLWPSFHPILQVCESVSVFVFFQFCDVAQVTNYPEVNLAKFGNIKTMKVKKILSTDSYCRQLWQLIFN